MPRPFAVARYRLMSDSSTHFFSRESSGFRVAAAAAVLVGLALRLWQYGAAASIWVDEAAVACNVLDRDVSSLLGTLDHAQIAPPAC